MAQEKHQDSLEFGVQLSEWKAADESASRGEVRLTEDIGWISKLAEIFWELVLQKRKRNRKKYTKQKKVSHSRYKEGCEWEYEEIYKRKESQSFSI